MEQGDRFDLGLAADLSMWMQSPINRRRLLKMSALSLGAFLAGCQLPAATQTASTSSTAATADCPTEIPGETAGPYPADGSNASQQTLNALDMSGIVRQDIRTSIGTQNTAQGVPMKIEFTLVNTNDACAPLAGYALYAWHCTREGGYSMYSEGLTDEDFLRGVQETDSEGKATFQSIFPGCYLGRWPHVHFEIYPSLEGATGSNNALHTSQLALPEADCNTVYATDGYASSAQNLTQITLATDNVFSDGYELQMATVTGNVTDGYTAKLTVGIAV
jgi:protocatechuate 3,4-dioxygenase beta subunit